METLCGEPTITRQDCIVWFQEDDDFDSADDEYVENPEKYDAFYQAIIFDNALDEMSKSWCEDGKLPALDFIKQLKWYMNNVNYFKVECPTKSLAFYLCMYKYIMHFPQMANPSYRKYLYDCTYGIYKWRYSHPNHSGICEVYASWAAFILSFNHKN
jgi:hypothetical protein